ncbi:MAG TPA: hypothetical protein VHI95_07035 [Acidimicrobiales bacterium]|nr:hypothetical protein [Acidimicrobiales bacterium]
MRRSIAIGLLPPVHARALVLAEEGLDTEELADQLDLDPSAVGPLLRVAMAKLDALLAIDEPPTSRNDPRPTNADGDVQCDGLD